MQEVDERQTKAVELYLQGKSREEAMLEAGYAPSYVERWHSTFLEREPVASYVRAVVSERVGMEDWRWWTMLRHFVERAPGEEVADRDWLKGMEMLGYAKGIMKRDSSKTPRVPINIHIHRKEEVIEVDSKRVD